MPLPAQQLFHLAFPVDDLEAAPTLLCGPSGLSHWVKPGVAGLISILADTKSAPT